jgi:hypothetical protein
MLVPNSNGMLKRNNAPLSVRPCPNRLTLKLLAAPLARIDTQIRRAMNR